MKPPRLQLVTPPTVHGKPPPHDLDAEGEVLAAAILHPSHFHDVRPILSDASWYSDPNRLVWQAACAVVDSGAELTMMRVHAYLKDHGLYDAIGSRAYLAELQAQAYRPHVLIATADRIARKARLRALIAEAQTISAEGYGEMDDEMIEAFIEAAPERLRRHEADDVDAVHIGEAMQRTWQDRKELAAQGKVRLGPSTGLVDVDQRIGGLRPGKVTVVGARSYVGKTAFAFQVASHVAIGGSGVALFELEAPEDETVDRIQYTTAGVDGSRLLRGASLTMDELRLMTQAAQDLSRVHMYLVTKPGLTISAIRASARRTQRALERRGVPLALIVIDYVQLVSAADTTERSGTREAQIASVSRAVKAMAMDLKTHVMILAQLNKDGEKREDARPQTQDFRECSAVEMDADHIILIHNPHRLERSRGERDAQPFDDVQLILGKNRGGRGGTIQARWAPAAQRFQCVDAERREDDYYGSPP